MLRFKFLFFVGTTLLLGGCSENFYAKYYVPTGVSDTIRFSGTPTIRSSSEQTRLADTRQLFMEGYAPIGESFFLEEPDSDSHAISQAESVDAAIVLLQQNYSSTVAKERLVDETQTYTVQTYDTPGGVPTSEQTVTVTTPTYESYRADLYNQRATFFAPLERKGLGVMVEDTTKKTRSFLGEDGGEFVLAVRKESPAAKAGIKAKDIILYVNDQLVTSRYDVEHPFKETPDKPIKMTLWSKGEVRDLMISVPQKW